MESDLVRQINVLADLKIFPDGTEYFSLSVDACESLAALVPGSNIEVVALEHGVIPERYARNLKSFSAADQLVLLKSHAAIVGLGGLGGAVTEILARAGVGTLSLIDHDVFEDHNLNRQLLSSRRSLGISKVDAAREKVGEINPLLSVLSRSEYIDEQNAVRVLGTPDVIVDCLDSIPARFIVEQAARQIGCPLVSGAIAGHGGQVTTIFPGDGGLRGIYGHQENVPVRGVEASLGVLPYTAILIASIECSEVTKVLLKKGYPLRNSILMVDLLTNTFEVMSFQGG